MIKLIGLLIAITFSLPATANIGFTAEHCIQNNIDLCTFAADIADSLNEQLPVKLNAIITMESAKASFKSVVVLMRLEKEQGNEFRDALLTLEDKGAAVKKRMIERILKGGCDDDNSAFFVTSGGKIEYRFLFDDDTLFASAVISSCHP
jgi:hypothetical protein